MYVHSLKLENIKAFDRLDLTFNRPDGATSYAGINVFVGGNASGKSTLLKCIAMALSGPTIANQQLISPAGWIRRGEKRGVIELQVCWDSIHDTFRSKGGIPTSDTFKASLEFVTEQDAQVAVLKSKDYYTPTR